MKGYSLFKVLMVAALGVATMTGVLSSIQGKKHAKATTRFLEEVVTNSPPSDVSPAIDKQGGWKSIYVFYGDTKHLKDTIPHESILQAQAGQDQIIHRLLNRRGTKHGGRYFIDLAANDAVRISNTYALEHFGWNGLCFEPNPRYWDRLSYRKCHVIGALVGSTAMEEVDVIFPQNGPLGGVVGSGFDNKPGILSATEKRFTVSLMDVLNMFQVPKEIDYLSLDVEGAEECIMMNFPFDQWEISLLTVERPTPTLQKLLQSNGYMLLKELTKWGESLWAHESMGFTPSDVHDVTSREIYVDAKNFVAGDLIID